MKNTTVILILMLLTAFTIHSTPLIADQTNSKKFSKTVKTISGGLFEADIKASRITIKETKNRSIICSR